MADAADSNSVVPDVRVQVPRPAPWPAGQRKGNQNMKKNAVKNFLKRVYQDNLDYYSKYGYHIRQY